MTTALWIALCASGLVVGFVGGFGYRRRSDGTSPPADDQEVEASLAPRVEVDDTAQDEHERRTHPSAAGDLGETARERGGVVASPDFAAPRVPESAMAAAEHEAAVIDLRPAPASPRPARPTRPDTAVHRRNGSGVIDTATPAASAEADRQGATIIDLRHRAVAAVPVHNLQFVRGIGPDLDLELRRHGIITLADFVALDDARIDELDELLVVFRAKRVRRKLQPRAAAMLEAADIGGAADEPDTTALRQVQGIGSTMARWLETQEILTLEQLAGLDDDDVAELQAGLAAFPGRIVQQRWVEQARKLIAGPTESP